MRSAQSILTDISTQNIMAEYPYMEPTGHNPDVLVSALVHNRAKDKLLVAKRPGTFNKGASPKGSLKPSLSPHSLDLSRLHPPDLHFQPWHPRLTRGQAASKPPAGPSSTARTSPPAQPAASAARRAWR